MTITLKVCIIVNESKRESLSIIKDDIKHKLGGR